MKSLFKKFILTGLLGSFLIGNSVNCMNSEILLRVAVTGVVPGHLAGFFLGLMKPKNIEPDKYESRTTYEAILTYGWYLPTLYYIIKKGINEETFQYMKISTAMVFVSVAIGTFLGEKVRDSINDHFKFYDR